ncbi:MAG: beta-N-acetylhexosaminidase [Propionibacteriales bacterium]|nr:beta-N-acetylhexosaminidase [Propionibacteriales bacterium]
MTVRCSSGRAVLLAPILIAVLVAVLVAGCSSSGERATAPRNESSPSATAAAEPSPTPSPSSTRTGTDPTRRAPGVTAAERRRAERAVDAMSLDQRAGQVIVASYGGTAPPVDLVRGEHLAGVVTFSDNIRSVDHLRAGLRRLQRADRRPWPVFTSVDQEGGGIARVDETVTKFPALMTYGAARRTDLARRAAEASGQELRAIGFTAVFAPVADVTSGPSDPTIGSRSAGSSPALVADVVEASVAGYQQAGILPVIKHFPGHGSVPADSHRQLPVQDASRAALDKRDFVPFERAAAAGAPAIMVGHIDVRAIDPGTPSSVSRKVVGGVLRDDFGYRGLVVTDSMQMAGLTQEYGDAEAPVAALRAGVDLLLMPADPVTAKDAIVDAVRDGTLSTARLDQAAERVVAHLIHVGATAAKPFSRHDRISQQASAAAVTVTDGPCKGRLVGDSVQPRGDPTAVRRFEDAARAAGLRTGGGDSVAFIGPEGGRASADVVVATDTPYPLGDSSAPVRIATYGETPGAMRALVDVLLGKRPAPGRLPVKVDGVTRDGCSPR